jgi:septal ring factor EnvC (AmiA/AmiB activator)
VKGLSTENTGHSEKSSVFAFSAPSVFSVAVACLLIATNVSAASVDARKGELKEVQGRIETLQRDLAKAEESHSDAVDQLRDTESAISSANRRLRELSGERHDLELELNALDAQAKRLDRQTAIQQNQLARLLNRQFVGGDSDALQMLLAGRDPNQAARDSHFLTKLSSAKAELIRELRNVAVEKNRLATEARERQAKLVEIEKHAEDSRSQLLEKQRQRQAMLSKIAGRIKAQRQEIGTLKRDEQRLGKLIEGLAKIAAARPRTKSGAVGSEATKPATPPPRTPAQRPKNADPGALGGAFGALRGKLRLPVTGSITGRFGATREEGGATWKGIFIRASEGAEVKVVAAGTVVFSDWLRGFGNLLIVDHGDDFLSVYGNNQALLRAAGNEVRNGETVATVGSSGGIANSGLYFELRHRGQTFDPLKWIGR